VEVTFFDAGHILGSSMALFDIHAGRNRSLQVCMSGEFGRKNKPIIRDPEPIPDCDYLVLESTYGDRTHEAVTDILSSLERIVRSTHERGGKIVIPAFAVERTQDLIYYLHILTGENRIPKLPVFVDSPMAVNATSIFRVHPECYDAETRDIFIDNHKNPFGFDNLRYIDSVTESKELNDLQGPAIIISSSGMCEAGRVVHHLAHTVSDPKNTVLIVGYMAANTLGRRIQEKHRNIRIFGNTFILRAQVEEIRALSSHADYTEMGEYVRKMDLKRLKKIFLVHGEEEAQSSFKDYLLKIGVADVEIVQYGNTYELE
jgi:metallo-beta-lactamase family protein